MLLFSSILPINDSFSKQDFIDAVIECNQTNRFPENRIENLKWTGKYGTRLGNDSLWMQFCEHSDFIAARYQKVSNDGTIWNTDYVFNIYDKKLAIQLDRCYNDTIKNDDEDFTTPHFIKTLVDLKCLDMDGDLQISDKPIIIDCNNINLISRVVDGTSMYKLPFVYVSRLASNQTPLDVDVLAYRLKGVAHVLVQQDKTLNKTIRDKCHNRIEISGSVGVYIPNATNRHRKFVVLNGDKAGKYVSDCISKMIIKYWTLQSVDMLYTWYGISNAALIDKWNNSTKEFDDLMSISDEESKQTQSVITELNNRIHSLTCENQGLREKYSSSGYFTVIHSGNERDYYEGEIKDIILSVLNDVVNSPHTEYDAKRRRDVIKDIIESNIYQHLSEDKKDTVTKSLKQYRVMTEPIRNTLKQLGMEIYDVGKHYKIKYHDDSRYQVTMSKTSSDVKSGINAAKLICEEMF